MDLSTDKEMEMGMDTGRSPRFGRRKSRRLRSLTLAIAAMALLGVGVASASAATSIVGVWSFGGGKIAIQPEGNGEFEGVVVEPTTFATCIHSEGQKIWKEITLQPDGSYWGLHQWYYAGTYEGKTCIENPERGHTAFRIVEEPSGSSYLRVCLSEPGKSQPTIPPGSSGIGASFGCVSSALISATLPTAPGEKSSGAGSSGGSSGTGKSGTSAYKEKLSLPSAKQCLSVRLFQIHLQNPKYDPFKTVSVTIKGRKIATVRKGNYVVATINLKGLPKGAFTIKIKATTVLGHTLSASRTYHTCIKKLKKSSKKG